MAAHKLQVFLAGRFDEHKVLRIALKEKINKLPLAEAIDLNDNAPDEQPAIARCYEAVDRAELIVLLVGTEYGTPPEGQKHSYTHLEHKRALSYGSKPILPFLIGDAHRQPFSLQNYANENLGQWVDEIRKKHTPSYLDGSLDENQLASDIFDEVLAWLVEIFVDVDAGELEDVGDDGVETLQDSPIRLEELLDAPKMSTDRPPKDQPLKILAEDHAKEALNALKLHFPQVAIHHLIKARELAPLDISVGYWLARLLIATGRRPNCKKGLQIALLCARVASGQETQLKLESMACNVLAARASERLGEDELAMQYAQTAENEMPTHWMAKLEYGRQLAFAGKKVAALGMAEEAFWLRPETINQVQSDIAYRGMRKDLDGFRMRLRRTVNEKFDSISLVESRIHEFQMKLSIDEITPLATDFSLLQSQSVASPETDRVVWEVDVDYPNDSQRSERRSILRLIGQGRSSAKSSLQMLQDCAKRLSVDAVAFEFGGDKGYTPAIKEHLQTEIDIVNDEIGTLTQQQNEAGQQLEQHDERRAAVLRGSMWAGGLAIVIAAAAVLADYPAIAGLLVALIGIGAWLAYREFKSLQTTSLAFLTKAETLRRKLTHATGVSDDLKDAWRRFEVGELRLRENIGVFCDLTNQFEIAGLEKLPLSPVVPMGRKGNQTLVRANSKKALELQIEVDDQLLPLSLRYLREDPPAKSKYWVARRANSGATVILSRSAAYFQ